MRVVYVGQYEPGSTSRMRGEYLKKILKASDYKVADITIPIQKTGRVFRSAGWRFLSGPLITNVNDYCNEVLGDISDIDLLWVDKGVFISPILLKQWKKKATVAVHYTPDTAFTYNRSRLFFKGIGNYDFCVTTKSFEVESYKSKGARQVIFCTQGYDPTVHRPLANQKKKNGIAFVGLNEPYREEVVLRLLEANLPVKIAGKNWKRFVDKHRHSGNLEYAGEFLGGSDYAAFYSGSQVGLGLISKKFPELHTTRHFEIPACGTALATERNSETTAFFNEHEAIFYSDLKELTERLHAALSDEQYLAGLTLRGYEKVTQCGYDYESILRGVLKRTGLIS